MGSNSLKKINVLDYMNITIDDKSGFCFGVVNAITKAEESLSTIDKVFSLGDIVHNRVEVQRLEKLGLESVNHDKIASLSGESLLIRAHGEPPVTYTIAEKHGVNIIDATCPVVAKLQKSVGDAHKIMKKCGGQVVILGKNGHAEVIGLVGQTDGSAIVIENELDLEKLNFKKPIFLLSQTTQSLSLFERVKSIIIQKAQDNSNVTIMDTICRQVANREPHLKNFSKEHDVIVFVSGKKSSNGKVLFEVCKGVNSRTYNIEDESEIVTEWFEGAKSLGICGATSTPKWIMKRVADAINTIVNK